MARRKQFSHPIILNNTNTFTHLHHLRQWPYTICGVVGWSLLHRNMCYFYLLVVLRTNLEINIWKRHFVFTPLQITRILFFKCNFSHISKEKQSNVTPKMSFFCFTISTRAKAEQPSKKGKNSQEVACAPPTGDKESVLLFAWSFVLRPPPLLPLITPAVPCNKDTPRMVSYLVQSFDCDQGTRGTRYVAVTYAAYWKRRLLLF